MIHLLRLAATPVAFFALTAVTIPAQELAVAPPGSPRLTFDVIAIHPSKAPVPGQPCFTESNQGGDGYQVRCMNVKIMISLMYKIPERQITGAPGWLSDEFFDGQVNLVKTRLLQEWRTKSPMSSSTFSSAGLAAVPSLI
jgi:hypothetical protein